jgi:hypothetical protein
VLAEQVADSHKVERELAEAQAALAEQVADSHKVVESEPVQEPEPVPEPAGAPAPADLVAVSHKVETPGVATVSRPGGWTIQALEQLVAERGEAFPDQVEEWRYYVHFLREHAGTNGELPASFDYLIEDTFAGIL